MKTDAELFFDSLRSPAADKEPLEVLVATHPLSVAGKLIAVMVALSDLLDEQNGPPLLTREEEWKRAVRAARHALGHPVPFVEQGGEGGA